METPPPTTLPVTKKRTKKGTVPAAEAEAAAATAAAAAPAPSKKATAPKKEKKPIQVVAVVTPDGIEGTFSPEPRKPLIVHLPFRSSEIVFNEVGGTVAGLQYDPAPPPSVQPYDSKGDVYFQVNSEASTEDAEIGVEKKGWMMGSLAGGSLASGPTESVELQKPKVASVPAAAAPSSTTPETYLKNAKLLLCYATKAGETLKVPEKTDVSCFWCSHTFENSPCFLPTKEEDGIFHVYGNFCTPQCGMSFLLQEHLDSHVRWERMALLHRMYRPTKVPGSGGGRLYPAPPRESLQKFGGPYTYEEYREIIGKNNVRVDIQQPPMVSILSTLDTKPIDFYDSSIQNTFTSGFGMDRFKAWSEQGGALRLKRSKPLKDRESTLDACFQINVKRAGEGLELPA